MSSPPVYLAKSNGSAILSAIDHVCEALSIEAILGMAEDVPIIVFGLGSDLAGCCGRAKMAIGSAFEQHNRDAAVRDCGVIVRSAPRPLVKHIAV